MSSGRARGLHPAKLLLLGFLATTGLLLLLRHRQAPAKRPSPLQSRADDLDDLTKKELHRRAQKADIAGRSEMSKDELIAAPRKARE